MTFWEGIRQMRKYGGLRLAVEYCRMGVGWKIFKRVCWCIFHGKPVKNVFYEANRMVAPILLDKYEDLIQESIRRNSGIDQPHDRAKIVWFCWLQGKEKMPEIVRACYNSLLRNIRDREFRFVDAENWNEYVEIPKHVVDKFEKGYIPASMFTDLIRLELLIKYAGSWIDATVLCTGEYDEKLLDADIFMYQYGKHEGLSNWFITSCTNNPMLMVIRDVLYKYWEEHNVVLDYFIFHLLFGRLEREYPDMISEMPYANSYPAIRLVYHWNKPFDKEAWERLIAKVHFHKLTWRVKDSLKNDKGNYYNHIVAEYL